VDISGQGRQQGEEECDEREAVHADEGIAGNAAEAMFSRQLSGIGSQLSAKTGDGRLRECRVLRDVIPPIPPGPEGSNGNG